MAPMRNLFSYAGKRVVVAGAGSGMGEATALVVASLGADEIVALDIVKPPLDGVKFLEVDLRDPAAIEGAVAEVAKGGQIDALFNSAGLPGASSKCSLCTVCSEPNDIGSRFWISRQSGSTTPLPFTA